MSSEASRRSDWLAWSLSPLAVPVLYLLSVPPLTLATAEQRFHDGFIPSDWGIKFSIPDQWLRDNTPMKGLLESYFELWWNLTD